MKEIIIIIYGVFCDTMCNVQLIRGYTMTKLTITQAAKQAGISRSTLYKKYITTGVISVESVDDKKFIDMSELIRVFGNVLPDDTVKHSNTLDNTTNTPDKDELIAVLKNQLAEAKEREEWLKLQLEKTTHLLEDKTVKRKKFLGIF